MKTLKQLQVVLALMLITSGIAQAQFAIGAKAGFNSSTQAELGQLFYDNDFKVGTQAGLLIDYRFHNIFSVQLEGNYISKGCKTNLDAYSSDKNIIRSFDYVNVPLLLKARFGESFGLDEKYRVFLYAGPYYSSLLSVSDYNESDEITATTDIEDVAKESDLGVSFGGGFTYILKTRNEIFLDIRYDMGLSEVVSTDNSLRNKTIGLSVGYRFF